MSSSDRSLPVQADLRYLLPLHPGQPVAVVNFGKFLSDALEKDRLVLQNLDASSSLAGVFLALSGSESLDDGLNRCVRGLQPGGRLLLCVPNRQALKNLKGLLRGRKKNLYSLPQIQGAMAKAGLQVESVYGLYESTNEPRFFVPLENLAAVSYFFDSMFTPFTKSAWLLQRISPVLIRLGLARTLFADFCLVARVHGADAV